MEGFPKEDLYGMECPYTWVECSSKFDEFDWILYLSTKISKPFRNKLRMISFQLLLGCAHGHKKESEKAFETFESCEKYLNELRNEAFFKDITEGIQHTITASKCHLNYQIGKFEIANEMASTAKRFKSLDKASQAAVLAIKAHVLREFGNDGMMKALECSKSAIELDPDDDGTRKGAWYYLTGKLLAHLRRMKKKNEMPSKEELQMLERSVKKNPFPEHFVVLADSYREAAKLLLNISYPKNKAMSEKMVQTSLSVYKEVLKGQDLPVCVLWKCGVGLIKLPRKFRNIPLAEEAFQMAYKLEPENPDLLLGMAYLEDWCKNDYKTALTYYEKSCNHGNFRAAIKMIKIRYKFNKEYNPVDDCDKMIDNLQNSLKSRVYIERIIGFMVLKGEYYLYVKNDLLSAAREWEIAMETLPDSNNLLNYALVFEDRRDTVNIYEILATEIKSTNLNSNIFSQEDKEYLLRLLKRSSEKIIDGTTKMMCGMTLK